MKVRYKIQPFDYRAVSGWKCWCCCLLSLQACFEQRTTLLLSWNKRSIQVTTEKKRRVCKFLKKHHWQFCFFIFVRRRLRTLNCTVVVSLTVRSSNPSRVISMGSLHVLLSHAWVSLNTPTSSHSPKICIVGQLVTLNCPEVWMWVCVIVWWTCDLSRVYLYWDWLKKHWRVLINE